LVHVVVLPVDIKLLLSFAGAVSSQGQSTACPEFDSFNALLMFYLYTNEILIVKNFFIDNYYDYQTVMFLPTKYNSDLNETNKNQRLLQCVTVASSRYLPQTPNQRPPAELVV
jgi:hypothetical protein